MRAIAAAAVAAGACVAGGLAVGTWMALDAGATTQDGICGGATYELEIDEDDDGAELGFELQASGPAQVWQVVVEQGGDPVLVGERTTDEDGELDVDAPVDRDGAREFRVVLTPPDGAPCDVLVRR